MRFFISIIATVLMSYHPVHPIPPPPGTVTVTATPYEALPFPDGFKCKNEGVFPHKINCGKYWLCRTDDAGEMNPAELYQCPDGYLYDSTTKFCNNEEKVVCSTMSEKNVSQAMEILKQARKLEMKIKEIEDNLNGNQIITRDEQDAQNQNSTDTNDLPPWGNFSDLGAA